MFLSGRNFLIVNNFFQVLLRLLALGTLSFVFIIAVLLLQPGKTHRKRKISTPFLKTSYLLYLAVFMSFIYFLLFTTQNLDPYFNEVNYLLTAMAGTLPTVTVLLRRKVHKNRSFYNYFTGILNLVITLFLVRFFFHLVLG